MLFRHPIFFFFVKKVSPRPLPSHTPNSDGTIRDMTWTRAREAVYNDQHQPLTAIETSLLRETPSHLRTQSKSLSSDAAAAGDDDGWSTAGFTLRVEPVTHHRASNDIWCNDVVELHVEADVGNVTHWVAAYSPAGANVTETAPTKYAILSEARRGGVLHKTHAHYTELAHLTPPTSPNLILFNKT